MQMYAHCVVLARAYLVISAPSVLSFLFHLIAFVVSDYIIQLAPLVIASIALVSIL